MSNDAFELDFVLVRGPSWVDRRLHVRLPRNGTPITIGRATHCTVLLDPSLLFSSQVHCSLFAMPVKAAPSTTASTPPPPPALTAATTLSPVHLSTATTTTTETETPGGAGGATSLTDAVTPVHQTTRPSSAAASAFTMYVTDLCSSNGTFVNGLRISGTDPTELQQGDVCIFGGMRDVEVGEALPADAYGGPELVMWRVDMGGYKESAAHDFDFTATPLVLPADDALAAEVRALLQTAQRSLPKPQRTAGVEEGLSATPAAQRGCAVAASTTEAGREVERGVADSDDSPRGVPQRLFPSSPPSSAEVAAACDRASVEPSRSVSLVAVDDTPIPADPPAAVCYTTVRLGNVAFSASTAAEILALTAVHTEEEEEGDGCKRPRGEADADPVDTLAAVLGGPPLLTCTATHLKWTMPHPSHLYQLQCQQQQQQHQELLERDTVDDAPADAVRQQLRRPFFGMLPVTSVATVLTCVGRRGLAVELREGCDLPLVEAAVTTGAAESRWVVWTLDASVGAAVAHSSSSSLSSPSAAPHGGCEQRRAKRARTGRGDHKAGAKETGAEHAVPPPLDGANVTPVESPEARFEAWLRHFRLFYGAKGAPPPHEVDAATFDLVLAPPHSPTTEAP